MKKFAVIASVAAVSTALFAAPTSPNGSALYQAKCAGCHGTDGAKASAIMNVKPVNTPDMKMLGVSGLATIIHDGVGKMPSFAGRLNPDEIKAVAGYVLTLK